MKICDHCQTPAACKAHEECLAPEATGPLIARRSATACSASPENERYLWMQLENARLERERARAALREIREGIMNEEENGLWEADVILSIIDRALSPEKLSPPKEKTP